MNLDALCDEKRNAAKIQVLAAWNGYQQIGRFVIAEEADAWMEKLANGEDTDAPECHK